MDKLKTVLADLSKLSNLVDNEIVKKPAYDKLVIKVNPSTGGLITKTQYDSDKQGLEKNIEDVDKKIHNTTGLVRKADYNTKIAEIENRTPDTTDLATNLALNTKATEVESKIPDITNVTTQAALSAKATETENKIPDSTCFITTPKFNKLTKNSVDARIKEKSKSFASKSQVDNALDVAEKIQEK